MTPASLARDGEALRRLRAAINDPERRVVVVRGPADVGKAELAESALMGAAADGALTGHGAYAERSGQAPFAPVLNALSGVLAAALDTLFEPEPVVADLMRTLGPAAEVLRRAGLQALPPAPQPVALSPLDRRGGALLLTEAVLDLARWLRGFGRPLVLLVGGWRRGGPDAAALLAALAEEAGSVTLLVTERDDDPPCALADPDSVWTLDLRGPRGADPLRRPERPQPAAQPSPRLGASARRMAAVLALWGAPMPRRLLAPALDLTARSAAGDLAQLIDAGLAATDGDAVALQDTFAGDLPPADSKALAQAVAERLSAAGAEAGPPLLDVRLAAGLEDAEPEAWRDRFAAGAAAARARLDLAAAGRFAEAAWRLRERAPPADATADGLILREAVLAAADGRRPADAEARAEALVARAASRTDLGADYALGVEALRSAGDPDRAWRFACQGLAHFGVPVPPRVQLWRLALAAARWRRRSQARAGEAALAEPLDGLTYLAHAAATLAFERDPGLAALIAFLSARRVRRSPDAAAFWSSVDTFLSAILGDLEGAARLGRQATQALTDASPFRAATLYRAHYFGDIWVEPLARLRPHAAAIYRLAILEGDVTFAGNAIRNGLLIGWRTAPDLARLREEFVLAERELRRLGDPKIYAHPALQRRVIEGLMRFEGAQCVPADDPELALEPLLALELASLYGDWPRAADLARRYAPQRRIADSHPGGVVWRFHETLSRLKTGARARAADLAFIRRAATLNPADHRPKLMILEAEALRARGRLAESLGAYEAAVEAAEAADCRLEAGVAAECAAAAARDAGKPDLAAEYEARAQRTWQAWGARAKLPADPALEAAAAQLGAAQREGRARSRLLAEVSHELRTPMQGLQGLLDLAAAGEADLDVAALRDMFGSLKRVVDDLTDFGALASGGVRLALGPVAIGELIRAEAGMFAPMAAAAGGRIDVAVAADVPAVVETDGGRVRQVLRNLLSNACKYGAGSPVSVTAAWQAGRLTLTVEDEGLGFSETDLRLLFEPFQRGAHAGHGQGLGLGLALSRRVAEQLGGALAAENRRAGGARFTFAFPAPTAAAGGDAPALRRPLRLLVCEDAPLVREVIRANLHALGHTVTAVGDGAAAWQAWNAEAFDAAILDWNVPGPAGVGLVERMAAAAPVLVLTASSDVAVEQQARAAGARLVLRKPVSAAELAEALAALAAPEATAHHDPEFDQRMASLQRAADDKLAADAQALIARWRAGEAPCAEELHRFAGLAAQFGHPALAAAAEAVEGSVRKREDRLATAISAFEAAAQSAPAAPSRR